jgi:catalase-peroxidase
VQTAWASAATYRGTDKRGGANGARIRLEPQKNWTINSSSELGKALRTLEEIQIEFNSKQANGKLISLSDLIVLGGCAAIEAAANNAGYNLEVPFSPGRTDALQEQTDIESVAGLEPKADGFRNYVENGMERGAAELLIDKAQLLGLTAPEMTVLIGGMRVLDTNVGNSKHGVFTKSSETLCNDFFVNLIDMSTEWKKSSNSDDVFEGYDRSSGELKWTGSSVDLAFGSNSQLRAISEVYASDDGKEAFTNDFITAWSKVMNNDRFDLA